jgi:hypothetical protein
VNFECEKNDFYWKTLYFQVQEKRIVAIFKTLEDNNFQPVLIKGWAGAKVYPCPSDRLSIDVDLAVSPEQYVSCKNFLAARNIGGIDLHEGLRHLDTLAWRDLFDKAQTVEKGGAVIRILAEEDHFRVLCVHWLNDGGVDRERLLDIFYAVENRADNFDWERCLNAVGEKRRKWIITVLAVTEKYLGLNLSQTPIGAEKRHIPFWFIKTIEKEWNNNVRQKPLEYCLRDKKEFISQLRIRFPPNPIQATIEMDGEIDERSRVWYQMRSFFKRANIFAGKMVIKIRRKFTGKV